MASLFFRLLISLSIWQPPTSCQWQVPCQDSCRCKLDSGNRAPFRNSSTCAVENYAAKSNLGFNPMRMSCLSLLIPATVMSVMNMSCLSSISRFSSRNAVSRLKAACIPSAAMLYILCSCCMEMTGNYSGPRTASHRQFGWRRDAVSVMLLFRYCEVVAAERQVGVHEPLYVALTLYQRPHRRTLLVGPVKACRRNGGTVALREKGRLFQGEGTALSGRKDGSPWDRERSRRFVATAENVRSDRCEPFFTPQRASLYISSSSQTVLLRREAGSIVPSSSTPP